MLPDKHVANAVAVSHSLVRRVESKRKVIMGKGLSIGILFLNLLSLAREGRCGGIVDCQKLFPIS